MLAQLVTSLGGKRIHQTFSVDLEHRVVFSVPELPPFMMSVAWL